MASISSSVRARSGSIEDDLMSLAGRPVVDRPTRNCDVQHLFQTQRLGAELHVGMRALAAANLILHRVWHAVVPLHRVGLAAQPIALRPERNAA